MCGKRDWTKRRAGRTALTLGFAAFFAAGVAAADEFERLALDSGWTTRTHGAWEVRRDHRDLFAMRHPWVPPISGGFASVSRFITLPETWTGPVWLHFYCSDDVHADIVNGEAAPDIAGRRFKQALVGERVVWNEDVASPIQPGVQPRHRVLLDAAPGQRFMLTLLVYDVAGADAPAAGADPDESNFMTHVYWGDVVLVHGPGEPLPGRRPSEARTAERHRERWPLPPPAGAWEEAAARLEISAPGGIPAPGFPVRQGLPFPPGKVADPGALRLQTLDEGAVPVQKTVLNRWPDGSLRWVLADFVLRPGTGTLDLAFQRDWARMPAGPNISEIDGGLRIVYGQLRFDAGAPMLVRNLRYRNHPGIQRLGLGLETGGEILSGAAHYMEVLDEGPIRTTVLLEGIFDGTDRYLGRFSLYIDVFSGLPYVRCWLRLINDGDASLPVSGLLFSLVLEDPADEFILNGKKMGSEFEFFQENKNTQISSDNDINEQDPAYVAWKGHALTVRDFRERFPKAIAAVDGVLALDLIAGGERPVTLTPGEANSHEIWLALEDTDPAGLARVVAQPPVLASPAYFCAAGALGPAHPIDGMPLLPEHLTETYGGKDWADLGQHFGVRHFPDSPYFGRAGEWSNNYYERMLNLWSLWLVTGNREWHDRASAVSRHIMDVAVIHSEVPGTDWQGAMHGPGRNHTPGPWNPTLRTAGLAAYQKLTGDPEARRAFLGVADYCVRTGAGIDGGSSRQQAGPFEAIVAAFWETGDLAFLDDGAARVESAWRAMDRRRGVWLDMHGDPRHRGNVPWMAVQAARPLYWWYRLTGDVEAAQAVVAIAESIICENTCWERPGHMDGYSHNPRFPRTARYDLLILPVLFAAHDLTGDDFFRDAAIAQWERWQSAREFDHVFNAYWNLPWLLWHLEKHGLLEDPEAPDADGEAAREEDAAP